MNKNIDIVDIFDEEMNKKDKKLERKVEKARLKEQKKEEKRKKKLEKEEDSEFQKYLEKVKEEKNTLVVSSNQVSEIPDVPVPVKPKKEIDDFTKRIPIIPNENVISLEHHPILNFFISVFSLILIVISIDYFLYNTYTNYVDLKTMITSIILVLTVITYLLSIIIKKESIKKFFQILSLILFTCYMGYYLFII